MRVLVSFLLVCVPSFAGTIYLDASCSGEVTTYTSDSASCGSYNPGASAEVSVTGQYVSAGAWAGYGQSASASASFTQDYVFTVWGGSGDGFAEPLLMVQGDRQGSDSAGASASLAGVNCLKAGAAHPCIAIGLQYRSSITFLRYSLFRYPRARTRTHTKTARNTARRKKMGLPSSTPAVTLWAASPTRSIPCRRLNPARCRFSPPWRAPLS